MGRGADQDIGNSRRKSPASLKMGYDGEGKKVRLGDVDSSGYSVGFISPDGRAWQDVLEHDEVRTVSALEEAMFEWYEGKRPQGQPDPGEIARQTCLDERNIEIATKEAQKNWQAIALRKQNEIAHRSEDFRLFWRSLGSYRYPLFDDGKIALYPSNIEGAEVELLRLTPTAEEKEKLESMIQLIQKRLQSQGLPSLDDEAISSLIHGPENQDDPGTTLDETFKDIVSDLEDINPEIWRSSLRIPFGPFGDSIKIEIERGDKGEALDAIMSLEGILRKDNITDEDFVFEIAARSIDPEIEKAHALEVLAEGEEHPFVQQAQAFGIAPEHMFRHAEEIALGKREDRAFVVAGGAKIIPQIGRVEITVSAENEDDLLRRAQMILPNAHLSKDAEEDSI